MIEQAPTLSLQSFLVCASSIMSASCSDNGYQESPDISNQDPLITGQGLLTNKINNLSIIIK